MRWRTGGQAEGRTAFRVSLGLAFGALLLSAYPPVRLTAQTRLADSLWGAGNYHAARAEYTRALHDDPGSVRALYRLGVLNAWDGKLDSALALFRDAREVEPGEPDVRIWEARVLQWQDRYPESLARFDSVITEFPNRTDARLGRAQALMWWGRMVEAEREYRALAEMHPNDQEVLAALAALLVRQNRLAEADEYVSRALHIDPHDRASLDLLDQISALRRPRLEMALGLSHDSDDNNAFWQTLETSLVVGPGLRGFASAEAYEASDPSRSGHRFSTEVGASWDHGNLGVMGALGIRSLNSDFAADRSPGTVRMSGSYRVHPGAAMGVGFAHYPVDETAFLLGSNLDISEFTVDGNVDLPRGLGLGFGGGTANYSDGNNRQWLVVALTKLVASRLSAGLYMRSLGYDFQGSGYFSPDHYHIGEVQATYHRVFDPWEARLSGGLGLQDVGIDGTNQTDARWHAEVRFARRWATINEIALSGSYSNNAISSVTGAYNYYTATLSARIGL
jgi:tetratricopeptide (TPR) repeat protein